MSSNCLVTKLKGAINVDAPIFNAVRIFVNHSIADSISQIDRYITIKAKSDNVILKKINGYFCDSSGGNTTTEISVGSQTNSTVYYTSSTDTIIVTPKDNIEHFADDPNLLPNEQVSNNGHDSFIEAITGAIYFDSDFSTAYDWVSKWLFDKLDLEVLK